MTDDITLRPEEVRIAAGKPPHAPRNVVAYLKIDIWLIS